MYRYVGQYKNVVASELIPLNIKVFLDIGCELRHLSCSNRIQSLKINNSMTYISIDAIHYLLQLLTYSIWSIYCTVQQFNHLSTNKLINVAYDERMIRFILIKPRLTRKSYRKWYLTAYHGIKFTNNCNYL